MVNVVGVRFQNAGKLYFFDPGELWPTPGDFVVVETARGIEFGEVVMGVHEMNDALLSAPLKQLVRIATQEDITHNQENLAAEKEAYEVCQKKIAEHKLDMKLVKVEYTFDNTKILFYFTANGRVDFRSLVKDLAGVFKTRIELRQIGVRDEAKMLGGLGPCGRPICCGAFLGDFQPVSIKMAKEQNLSLNPIKISGVCSRLMCCLKYEQDSYEETRRRMPRVGRSIETPDGYGTVVDLNIIKETVRVRLQKGDSSEMKDYPLEELQALKQNHGERREREMDAQDDFIRAEEAAEEATEAPAETEAAEAAETPAAEAPAAENAEGEKPAAEKAPDRRPPKRERSFAKPREAEKREEAPAAENVPKAEPVKRPEPVPAPEAAKEAPKPQNNWKAMLEAARKAAANEGN